MHNFDGEQNLQGETVQHENQRQAMVADTIGRLQQEYLVAGQAQTGANTVSEGFFDPRSLPENKDQ